MIKAVCGIVAILIGIVCVIAWLIGLWNWDWTQDYCTRDDCEKCPFPCNDRKDL